MNDRKFYEWLEGMADDAEASGEWQSVGDIRRYLHLRASAARARRQGYSRTASRIDLQAKDLIADLKAVTRP